MDEAGTERERAWEQAHGTDVPAPRAVAALVRGYLAVMHLIARPLVLARVPPAVVTLGAVLVSLVSVVPAAAGGRWALGAAVLLAVGGLADSLDGQVARESGRTSRTGALADAVGDRLADAAGPAVLWLLGAPAPLVLVVVGVGVVHEYARARAQVEGMTGPGAVTVSERPTRVAVTAMFALGCGVYPAAAAGWATTGAAVAAALALAALVQVLLAAVSALRGPRAGG